MRSCDIRRAFIDFFKENGHTAVPSSSLIPDGDDTLLFTNAGMVPFKNVFIGKERLPYDTAVSVQRCLRAGGKHNDLENVGYTSRHHTFFEMLGNFSFGSYFKERAIQYAWTFLTSILNLDKSRLWITVYYTDDVAYDIWRYKIGIAEDRVIRIGAKGGDDPYCSDNFWQMGPTGPCGPCTEIFFDHGPSVAGGPPGSPDADGDRFVEIWNLVFMEFNRDADGVLGSLPHFCVDTGMGLERISAVMQGVTSNYDIDIFSELSSAVRLIIGKDDPHDNVSVRVISDHIRSAVFLIADGVLPGNEGRSYVLRRIIRRAVRHGYQLGQHAPFFYKLVPSLVLVMGDAYIDLKHHESRISSAIKAEEERFFETLEHGMNVLERELSKNIPIIGGELAFKLYDTFGFPLDLTEDICRSRNVSVDIEGFERAMSVQRETSRAHTAFHGNLSVAIGDDISSDFCAYECSEMLANIIAIYIDNKSSSEIYENQKGFVVFDRTPFYPEGGGQVGDSGRWISEDGSVIFTVGDTCKVSPLAIAHYGVVSKGSCRVGDTLKGEVDNERRLQIARHHSATHLLHAALRQILGTHVQQRGSHVDEHRLRFDFSHHEPISDIQIAQISDFVNGEVLSCTETKVSFLNYQEAINSGAVGLFSDKYKDMVRVLQIGCSRELCGGIHVRNTGSIGLFAIISESAIASGVRRIEAVAGFPSIRIFNDYVHQIKKVSEILNCNPESIYESTLRMSEKLSASQKLITQLNKERLLQRIKSYKGSCRVYNGVSLFMIYDEDVDKSEARFCVDSIFNDCNNSIIIFVTGRPPSFNLICSVVDSVSLKVDARSLLKDLSSIISGKGGGRANFVQSSASFPGGVSSFFDSAFSWIAKRLDDVSCHNLL
ncbi:alanine--tRNA ligase [Candidatus Ichthyocystis hellenicum]|uniref:alanine--tRNA ligase n=1 Tax=Candidatus Ichthyocystis hellenicum TaxID=1561003 RepID=UPI000AB2F30F|nr:alanine--tRNA ligase [Candidatus Ichthyocystis hellenicum]